jgi:predicted nuclease of predicted toxin-antitoxin system
MKIYADEDIEDDIVEIFKSEGVNIKSAREIGLRGKPDSFQAAYALKEKRFLLTRNGKDFWDDRALPMNQTYGLLVLDADPNDTITYLTNAFQRIVTYS